MVDHPVGAPVPRRHSLGSEQHPDRQTSLQDVQPELLQGQVKTQECLRQQRAPAAARLPQDPSGRREPRQVRAQEPTEK